MGGDLVTIGVVCRVLHRAEIPDLVLLGDDHQTARVLACGTSNADTSTCQSCFLSTAGGFAPLGQVLLHIAKGGLFRNGADGSRTEHMGRTEHGNTILVGFGLIFT